jgi:hypothetical protein
MLPMTDAIRGHNYDLILLVLAPAGEEVRVRGAGGQAEDGVCVTPIQPATPALHLPTPIFYKLKTAERDCTAKFKRGRKWY